MSMKLVIVESPAKAKKIRSYLGKDYKVEASIGHIRDLPTKKMGVDIEAGFEPEYEISPQKKKRVTELKKQAKGVQEIILATDPDREGEAIAWHLAHIFGLDPKQADRVTYNEITKKAILDAFSKPKKIDIDLVNAQQSRRILDRIVGYELSPLLWKKVQAGLSAGRVQSVAVKILVEREREIRAFEPKESWQLQAHLIHTDKKTLIPAELSKISGKKKVFKSQADIEKFLATHQIDLANIELKKDKKQNLHFALVHREDFVLENSTQKQSKRNPGAPFTTSTLQQEASRKLGMGVKRTMQVAQSLYQNGHITYMRTDSVHLSGTAIEQAKNYIIETYGSGYALSKGRQYKTKQNSAQEAHEAIRPTDITKKPNGTGMDAQEAKLYKLIWERTVASQMKEAIVELTTYEFSPKSAPQEIWTAKGEVITFPGFMKLYIEGVDDDTPSESTQKKELPKLSDGAELPSKQLSGQQKFTLPPARYTEASLVKKLESEGIGRPSTYAPTIATIQERGYVVVESKKLVPTDIAFVVTDYLSRQFPWLMRYDFTAKVEEKFDAIAGGKENWKDMLSAFYKPFHVGIVESEGSDGKFSGERILGKDEKTGRTILARMSRFGPVIQIGTPDELAEDEKPRYANLTPGLSIDDISLEEAQKLFSFPKDLGEHEGQPVLIGQGRYGPYVKWGTAYVSIPRDINPHAVDIEMAKKLIEEKKKADAPIGTYEGEPYTKGKGRFGPFLKYKNLYVSIPRAIDPEDITQEQAHDLIAKKIEKEANRYIQVWEEEGISIENGRWGPFIKFNKKNLKLEKNGERIKDADLAKKLTLDEVKAIITDQIPGAFKEKSKKTTKKKSATKKKK
ncbi:DNA topoisomerase I [Candidatus Gracilibacteria bacterium]|nr:MAG: DNA topoisomerase I [Candidatus Gracilibacteria bacterium]